MPAFTPSEAAEIAFGVYSVRTALVTDPTRPIKFGVNRALWTPVLQMSSSTGIAGYEAQTGFGYVCEGKGGKARANEILIATRGTDSLYDVGTDVRIGLTRGPGGMLVHEGFNTTATTVATQVDRQLANKNPSAVHVVGHSLGGAIAALIAARLAADNRADIYLYTFGQPRTGCSEFAEWLDDVLGDRYYRVVNPHDPVPMVPCHPFIHAPISFATYMVQPAAFLMSPTNHSMRTGYLPGVRDTAWANLIDHSGPDWGTDWDDFVAASASQKIMKGSGVALTLIGQAAKFILSIVADNISSSITEGMTVIDALLLLLKLGVRVGKKAMEQLAVMAQWIFAYLGRVVNKGQEMTVAFLRWLVDLLIAELANAAILARTTLYY